MPQMVVDCEDQLDEDGAKENHTEPFQHRNSGIDPRDGVDEARLAIAVECVLNLVQAPLILLVLQIKLGIERMQLILKPRLPFL